MVYYAATIIHKKLLIVVSPSTSKNWAADAIGAANNGPIIGIQNTTALTSLFERQVVGDFF